MPSWPPWQTQHPGLAVEVFRAPTGELDARIASELRSGGIGADVLWVSDPLSLQRYDADGLLAALPAAALDAVPTEYRTDTMLGTRLLNLVIVAGQDVEPAPTSWADLADPAYVGAVAIPDPGVRRLWLRIPGPDRHRSRARHGLPRRAQGQRRCRDRLAG